MCLEAWLCPIVADGDLEETSNCPVTKSEVAVFGCRTDSAITFPELLAGQQQRLMSYVVSLLGKLDTAWNVVEETNRVLLEKRDEFRPGSNFMNGH